MPNLPYSSTPTLPFGGKTVTISGVTYVARNWNPQFSSRKIRRDDENGDEAAFMLREEPASQSGLVLQPPLSSTTRPSVGTEFTGPSPDNVTHVITAVSPAYQQGDFWVFNIDYQRKALPGD